MRKMIGVILTALIFSTFTFAEERGPESEREKERERERGRQEERDDHDDGGPIYVGWAIVTPMAVTATAGSGTVVTATAGSGTVTPSASTSGLVVFETFGHKEGAGTTQAGLLPTDLTTSALMFVNASGKLSRNIGIGIVNPNNVSTNVTMTLHGENGNVIGTPKTITVAAGQHTAQFITAFFADRPEVPKDLTGTVTLTSTVPVSMVGLRFRGSNFSTIPITNLSPSTAVPQRGTGVGGPGAVVLTHFAAGGGWATELVIVNTGSQPVTVRVDFFKQDGTPMTVRLNGESKSSFTDLAIPAGGVLELAPKDREGHSRF